MVWPRHVFSFHDASAATQKNSEGKSQKEVTSSNTQHLIHRNAEESDGIWPSNIVLDETTKSRKVSEHQRLQDNVKNSQNIHIGRNDVKSQGTWPSDVVLEDRRRARKKNGRQEEMPGKTPSMKGPMDRETTKSSLWNSLASNDEKIAAANGRYTPREIRNDRSSSMRGGRHEEREGSINEQCHSDTRHKHTTTVQPSSLCHLSYPASCNSEYAVDETRPYGIDHANESTLVGRSALETFEAGTHGKNSQDDANSSFRTPTTPENTEGNNLVATLVHLTKKCYAPPDPDIPY